MEIKDFENLIKDITQEDLDNDIKVKIISAFGGSKCWEGNISELLDVIRDEERCVNKDFYVLKI